MNLTEKIIKEFEDTMESLFQWKYQYDAEYEALDGNTGSFWSNDKVKKLRDDFINSSLKQVATETVKAMNLKKRNYIDEAYEAGCNTAISDIEQNAKKFLDENFSEKKD